MLYTGVPLAGTYRGRCALGGQSGHQRTSHGALSRKKKSSVSTNVPDYTMANSSFATDSRTVTFNFIILGL